MKQQTQIQIEKSLHSPIKGKIIDLSKEVLSVSDYEWLAEKIIKLSVVETILLPNISQEKAEMIVSILNKATIKTNTLISMDINITSNTAECPENILLMCQQIQSRLQRNKKKIFGIHGGGNIGLGLMAYIVSQSQFDYDIVATSNNSFTGHLINSINMLWLQHNPFNSNDSTCVRNVMMISRNSQEVIHLYNEAAIVALCVTPTVMPNISKDIAHALINRFKKDGSGLKILVLMNLPDCATFVRDKIFNEILSLTKNESYAKKIISMVECVPTVIDRIVTPIPEEKIKLQLKEQLEKIDKNTRILELEDDNIDHILMRPDKLRKAIITFNLKFNLFNAEKNFSMYVHDSFIEAIRFPLIKRVNDLSVIEAIKNKYINGPHAILAWTGALLGYKTIAESIKYPFLFSFIKKMMEYEIGPILCAEYPELSKKDLEELKDIFFDRCRVSVEDTVTRVGRDPMRKLDSGGRVRGTIELAKKHNLTLSMTRLEQGLAAGFLYAIKFDPTNPGCQKIREIYELNHRSLSAVLCYNGQAPSGNFKGLNSYKDKILINRVMGHFDTFNHLYINRFSDKESKSSTALVLSNIRTRNIYTIPKSLSSISDHFFYRFIKLQEKNKNQSSQMIITNTKMGYGIWHHSYEKSEISIDSKEFPKVNYLQNLNR